jgi:hypothetical protein
MQLVNIAKIQEGLYSVESPPCSLCGESYILEITGQQLWAYNNNAHVQEVMPEVAPEIRERFISGTCSACWDQIFPEEDEE